MIGQNSEARRSSARRAWRVLPGLNHMLHAADGAPVEHTRLRAAYTPQQ
jgi:hypothetical protein